MANPRKAEALAHYYANGRNSEFTAEALGLHGGSIRKWVIAAGKSLVKEAQVASHSLVEAASAAMDAAQSGVEVNLPTMQASFPFFVKNEPKKPVERKMAKILLIPDSQIKPGVPMEHMQWAGQYFADMTDKPTHIVHIGDHWDMPSLSSYDKGKKSFEGRKYIEDIKAGNDAMEMFQKPVDAYYNDHKGEEPPEQHFHLGNHEARIMRAIEDNRELEGLMGYHQLELSRWNVHNFKEVNVINGVAFSHFFCTGMMGRPASSARAILTQKHMSCVQGHVQKLDIAYGERADGKQIIGLMCGTFYQHDEGYLGPQGNGCYRGIHILSEVEDGGFTMMQVSMAYLKKKYG